MLKSPPKNHYESRFKAELGGYTVDCIELTAPLLEHRPWIWWLGSRSESFTAQQWIRGAVAGAMRGVRLRATAVPALHVGVSG